MSEPPAISVIIPTFNRAARLQRAIRSVMAQTWHDLEIIVVDDGSTDATQDVLGSIREPRLIVVRHEANLGSPVARNSGMSVARGQFVAFLDSDDEWLPAKLERQVAVFETSPFPALGAVNCGLIVDSEGSRPTQAWLPSARGEAYWTFLARREYHDTASMWLIRKRELDRLEGPFDPALRYTQVADLLVRLAKTCEFDYVAEPLVVYHNHNESPRNEHLPIAVRREAYHYYMAKHAESLARRPDIHVQLLVMCAARCLGEGMAREARQDLARAVQLAPLNRQAWTLLALARLHPRAYAFARTLKRRLTGQRLNDHRPYTRH